MWRVCVSVCVCETMYCFITLLCTPISCFMFFVSCTLVKLVALLVMPINNLNLKLNLWPTWGPHGSCRSQVDPMLAPWTFLSVYRNWYQYCHYVLTNDLGIPALSSASWGNNNRMKSSISMISSWNKRKLNKWCQDKYSKYLQNGSTNCMVACAELAIVPWGQLPWLFNIGNIWFQGLCI